MDSFTLGKSIGFLRAFEHLNMGFDHSPSYELEAVPWKTDVQTSVLAHFCSYPGSTEGSWTVSVLAVPEGTDVLKPLLKRWLFHDCFGTPTGKDAELWPEKQEACVEECLALLTRLFGGGSPRVWRVDAQPTDGGFYELVWDDLLLELEPQLFLLHLGFSD